MFLSVYRAHDAQNDLLELTVLAQKSVFKNVYQVQIIGQNTQKCKGLVCQSEFMHILVLKPWAKASRFYYHEPNQKRKNEL